ncbi:MAG: acyl-CoA thioesterase [Candidatus Cloacimonetes bacterium]|nr:acyl-CoA thioesterase [Candidatus Cloacimonadota bacterium]
MVLEYKRKIFGYECDIYGHLNNANYLHLYEEARAGALEQMGLAVRELNQSSFHIYLTSIELTFKKGIPLEETVTIKSSINEMNRVSTLWEQKIYNSKNELCNTAIVKGVFVKNGKPVRLPKEIYTQFNKFKKK